MLLQAMLDAEFVFGKGRTISLAQRFPLVFNPENAANIFLAEEGGRIVSACVAKLFNWKVSGKAWRGAMIGAVWTAPALRGKGLAGSLLPWACARLTDSGTQFAVLWATRPRFYERLGWGAADTSVLGIGEFSATPQESNPADILIMPLASSDERQIEALRVRWMKASVERAPLDYHQTPLPAERVDVVFRMQDKEPTAYALLGRQGETDILYELAGDEDGFACLWQAIRSFRRNIIVNDAESSFSYRWLARKTDIRWESKKLAMWLPLCNAPPMAEMAGWYIPYFDRI